MPVQDALAFLGRARRDESLVSEIDALDGEVSLESLTRVANDAGYRFTPEELERAQVLDWRMRWARYQ